jgi:hypothetical protein
MSQWRYSLDTASIKPAPNLRGSPWLWRSIGIADIERQAVTSAAGPLTVAWASHAAIIVIFLLRRQGVPTDYWQKRSEIFQERVTTVTSELTALGAVFDTGVFEIATFTELDAGLRSHLLAISIVVASEDAGGGTVRVATGILPSSDSRGHEITGKNSQSVTSPARLLLVASTWHIAVLLISLGGWPCVTTDCIR